MGGRGAGGTSNYQITESRAIPPGRSAKAETCVKHSARDATKYWGCGTGDRCRAAGADGIVFKTERNIRKNEGTRQK